MEQKGKRIIEACESYAKSQGFRLNPDRKAVEAVVKGLIHNQKKHGARYCPCRFVSGDKEKDRLIICPCVYHKDEIEKDGHCHCGLFVK
jgi:ferredoxin-thioredoxin reductase catalytic chain